MFVSPSRFNDTLFSCSNEDVLSEEERLSEVKRLGKQEAANVPLKPSVLWVSVQGEAAAPCCA